MNPNSVGRLSLHVPPSDRAVMGVLTLAVLVAGVSWRPPGQVPSGYFTLHSVLLAGFTAIAVYLGHQGRASAVQLLRRRITVTAKNVLAKNPLLALLLKQCLSEQAIVVRRLLGRRYAEPFVIRIERLRHCRTESQWLSSHGNSPIVNAQL